MFERSTHNKLSFFIISQDYYDLRKKKIRADDMTLIEFNFLTSTCWNEKYQPFTIGMTKYNQTGQYRLGLKIIILPTISPL